MDQMNFVARGAIALIAVASLSACSGQDDSIAEPTFAPVGTATASASSESASASVSSSPSASSQSSSSSPSSSSTMPTTQSGGAGAANPALYNGDGTYSIVKEQPGPGPNNNIEAIYRNIPESGFSELKVKPTTRYMSGRMQYVLDDSSWNYSEFGLDLEARGVDGSSISDSVGCRVDFELYDVSGAPLPVGETSDKNDCWETFYLNLDTPGDQTVIAKIYQPGYPPLVIKQNIRVLE